MKKKILIILGTVVIVCALFLLVIKLFSNEKNNNNFESEIETCNYYAHACDFGVGTTTTYTFALWENGYYKMEELHAGSALDVNTTIKKYDGNIENDIFEKAKQIFKYLNDKYGKVEKNNNIIYSLDFKTKDVGKEIDFMDNHILVSTLICITNDKDNNEKNLVLDEILDEISQK